MNTGGFNGGVDVAMILVMVLRSHDWVPEMRVLTVRGSRNSWPVRWLACIWFGLDGRLFMVRHLPCLWACSWLWLVSVSLGGEFKIEDLPRMVLA